MTKLSAYALMLLLDAHLMSQSSSRVHGSLYELYAKKLFDELIAVGCFMETTKYSYHITAIGRDHVAKVLNQTIDRI